MSPSELKVAPPPVTVIEAPSYTRKRLLARAILFLWSVLVACPVRYWPVDASIDNTWIFALNYAAAHGLAYGRDVIWTSGPLGYLVYPLDIGQNLAHALLFQAAVWVVLIAILTDVFYRADLRLRSLALFCLCFALSAPLYWFNYMGVENLLLAGALILLVMVRFHGGLARYVTALVLIGIIPLIKLTGGMLALGAVLGFLVDQWIRDRRPPWLQAAYAAIIPGATAGLMCWLVLPSWDAFGKYLRLSVDIIGGYSTAMSNSGDHIEFAGAAETLVCAGALLFWKARSSRRIAWFYVALLGIPILMSLKHGFVRQDVHVINFFFFVGLALSLIVLAMPLDGRRSMVVFLVLLNYGLVSLEYMVARVGIGDAVAEASGLRGASMAWAALHPSRVRAELDVASRDYPAEARAEPEMRTVVGRASIASLSMTYSGALLDGLNLDVYPVVQRYSAYTHYLDESNAAWVRDKGSRFLMFDGSAIDGRQSWAETPAMWLEIYRWYDTRLLGKGSLLLERRARPRFTRVLQASHFEMFLADGLDIPASETPVLWSLDCHLSAAGSLQKLLFRVPQVLMTVDGKSPSRVIPEVLTSPVMGNFIPESLGELAALMTSSESPKASVKKLKFSGPGLSAYAPVCQAALWSLE